MSEIFTEVPVVDISEWMLNYESADGNCSYQPGISTYPNICETWNNSLMELGFVLVTGHNIPHEVFVETLDEAKSFFDCPLEIKERFIYGEYGNEYVDAHFSKHYKSIYV